MRREKEEVVDAYFPALCAQEGGAAGPSSVRARPLRYGKQKTRHYKHLHGAIKTRVDSYFPPWTQLIRVCSFKLSDSGYFMEASQLFSLYPP